jgi:hypothetical protein
VARNCYKLWRLATPELPENFSPGAPRTGLDIEMLSSAPPVRNPPVATRDQHEAQREANTALVLRTLESYARHNAEQQQHDEHGPRTT